MKKYQYYQYIIVSYRDKTECVKIISDKEITLKSVIKNFSDYKSIEFIDKPKTQII